MSTLGTVTMLRVTVESIHQMATSVCDYITNCYYVTFDSGEYSPDSKSVCVYITNIYYVTCDSGDYSPDGNISMCLHYEQLLCYVWQWSVFTRWQHQYVSTLRTVTMLRVTVESIHQMATSVCVYITNCYYVKCDSGEYSPDSNVSMCLHYEQLLCYVW